MSFISLFFVFPLPFLTFPLIACGVGGDCDAPKRAADWPCDDAWKVLVSSTLYTPSDLFLNFSTSRMIIIMAIMVPAMIPITIAVFSAAREDMCGLLVLGG